MHQHSEKSTTYQSYLLRMWRECGQEDWRWALQSVQSGDMRQFVNITQLIAFLLAQSMPEIPAVSASSDATARPDAGASANTPTETPS